MTAAPVYDGAPQPHVPILGLLIAGQRGRGNVDHRRDRATCIRRDDRGSRRDRGRVRPVAAQGRPCADPPRLHDRSGDASRHRSSRLVADPAPGRLAAPLPRAARGDRAVPVVRRADTHRPGSGGAARCADSPSWFRRWHQGQGARRALAPVAQSSRRRQARPARPVGRRAGAQGADRHPLHVHGRRLLDLRARAHRRPGCEFSAQATAQDSPGHVDADRPEAGRVRARRARA